MSSSDTQNKPADQLSAVKPPTMRMILSLTLIATVSGVLIVLTHFLTLPIIEQNKRIALQNSITAILPGTQTIEGRLITTDGKILDINQDSQKQSPANQETPTGTRVYIGKSNTGQTLGIVIEASGSGFQDIIDIIYAYDPLKEQITGMTVMASKETPGLGDKIETDSNFKENFKALAVELNQNAENLAHSVIAVKAGKKTRPWQVEGITGATISSKAIAKIIDGNASEVLPVIQAHLDRFGYQATQKSKSHNQIRQENPK